MEFQKDLEEEKKVEEVKTENQVNPFAKNTKDYWVEEAKRLKVELLPEDNTMAEIKAKVLAKYKEQDEIEKVKVRVKEGFVHWKGKNYISKTENDTFEIEKAIFDGNLSLQEVLEVLE
jgi:ATP-dependent Clp protease adapter protein ClpS